MKLMLTFLIFANTYVSLVMSNCYSFGKSHWDSERLCNHWWEMAHRYSDSDSGKAAQECVGKIQATCPNFLMSVDDKYKVSQKVESNRITWTITGIANKNGCDEVMYDIKQHTGICNGDDVGLGNCDFWWLAAAAKSNYDSIMNRCISLIERNCSDKLTEVSRNTVNVKNRGSRAGQFSTITYRYKDYSELTVRQNS